MNSTKTSDPSGLVSVIIPAYKMGRYVRSALDSVAAQHNDNWEVIVVEDCGPEDGTEAIVRDFAKAHPDHRVEFIRHERNSGVSGARNTAITEAKGECAALRDRNEQCPTGRLCKRQATKS